MEGGGIDLETESQALYEGELVGLDYYPLEDARLRMFGGSSMHWGGRCSSSTRQLPVPALRDPDAAGRSQDRPRPLPAETDTILDLIPVADLPDMPVAQAEARFHRIQYRYSPPTRFGEKYKDEIAASQAIVCAINANLVDIRLDDGLATVTGAASSPSPPATRASPSGRGSSCSASGA